MTDITDAEAVSLPDVLLPDDVQAIPPMLSERYRQYRERDAARRRHPAYLADQLFRLAEALNAAERALNRFWKDNLRNMPAERAAQLEALFPDTPPYFEIEPYATNIKNMADEWQEEIDAKEDNDDKCI